MSDDNTISLADALNMCVKAGMSRRAAKRLLMKGLREGKLRATGVISVDGQNLGRQAIKPEMFDVPWKDDEGDRG
jgi:hypothetical protein